MNVSSRVSKFIKSKGIEVSVKFGGDNSKVEKTVAIIQHFDSKNYSNLHGKFLASGYIDNNRYIYIGPSDLRLDTYYGEIFIIDEDIKYTVIRAEKVCYCNKVVYVWALLQKVIDDEI